MDFYDIQTKKGNKKGTLIVSPNFKVCRTKDLMVRGKSFYGVWNEELGLWSTDEYDIAKLVDMDIRDEVKKLQERSSFDEVIPKYMGNYDTGSWKQFREYIRNVSDNYKQLDEKVTFANSEVTKKDYISRRLPYSLEDGTFDSYDKIMNTLYDPEERQKLEWAIGAIISGDAKHIQKFIVLYGDAGAGKSTVLNIIQQLFEGYYTIFDAKALTSSSNAFSTEQFRSNPLVAIQHDGDLSRIEDNTKLNSIVSHEEIVINEKYKSGYPMKVNCFLFMATNKPIKITDAKSGLIRRLIDVRPSGRKLPVKEYNDLYSKVQFELGAIANHCLQVYKEMGKGYYSNYRPVDMMYKTDPFFNFVEDSYNIFKKQDGVTLKQAYAMYKEYCDETNADYKLQMYKFREELKNYFKNYDDTKRIGDKILRSYYSGFLSDKFKREVKPVKKEEAEPVLKLNKTKSVIFDEMFKDCPAQYATDKEIPTMKWEKVTTTLGDISTDQLHYVKVPENLIVIDFDLRNESGEKDFKLNLEAASKFPPTYTETSKSGAGIHLHYIYTGDVSELSRVYDDNIEIKVFTGNSSLRRKVVKCNDTPIAKISSGLPLKEKGDKMVNFDGVKTEKGLRKSIMKGLRKEVHPGTKPSIDFIFKILDDAYNEGLHYDVTDLRPDIYAFAANSTHQSDYCLKLCDKMKFKSDEPSESPSDKEVDESKLIFYDVEVFPNLFLVNWKFRGEKHSVNRMINPTPAEIEDLLRYPLVGFNCRRYDNHIMYARMMGYSNEDLYDLSQRIISGSKNAMFSEAYNLSYTDVYDFASKKQSLKKWEIELKIHHHELGLPWDQPVPEELWTRVAEYCDDDVLATEAVFDHLQGDFTARKILADLAGMTVNDTTNSLTTRIIFGNERHPKLVYTDLKTGKQYF